MVGDAREQIAKVRNGLDVLALTAGNRGAELFLTGLAPHCPD